MKNIVDICKDFGFEIPADKEVDFLKAVNTEYKTTAEHQKVLEKLNTVTQRAETAEEALKGFDGISAEDFKSQLAEAQNKVKEAQTNAQKQLEERDFNDALRTELDNLKFSSTAARKSIEAEIKAAGLKMKDSKILGLSDMIEQIKKADASAFVDEDNPPAQFTTQHTGGTGNSGSGKPSELGKLSMADYIAARNKK